MTYFLSEKKINGQIKGLISSMWLILLYTVQLIIIKLCTKFQEPKPNVVAVAVVNNAVVIDVVEVVNVAAVAAVDLAETALQLQLSILLQLHLSMLLQLQLSNVFNSWFHQRNFKKLCS